ncbi:hypothetical protein DEJ48_36675 [Streptomyces venezuelae]|uniref:HTH gntR-type domain-containing protein n=1 Tax=Streptomyces venezuelae TaxID=54571 RepID=A0A5P2C624_STRVZ|nr:GntR family transcriptional regulator [Streptomyces venezuelae]QES38225.1 hypothetical protein DEJ48_36675 [Streptomyces venezuelae]
MTKELRRDGLEQVQILYKALRCEIERGDLEPGRVVTYSEICARIAGDPGRFPWNGYSVAACALWLLRREGLVETRPRLGTRIIVEGETWAVAGRDASEPLAVHIERVMRHRLADRVYPPNTRIPTLHLLAEEFGVSVKTVRNGLEALFEEGLLLATHPGTYVTARTGQVPREELLRIAERPQPGAAWSMSRGGSRRRSPIGPGTPDASFRIGASKRGSWNTSGHSRGR